MSRARWLAGAALALSAPAAATDCPGHDTYQALEVGYAEEALSPESPHWTDLELRYRRALGPRRVVFGGLRQSSRFDLDDTTVVAGAYWPLAADDTLFVEGAASPTHEVLPRHSLQVAWNHAWGRGWGTQFGARQVAYTATDVTLGELTLERYLGDFRLAYGYWPSRSSTAGRAASHRVHGGHYYGEYSSVQLVLVAGDEVDTPVAGGSVVSTEVRSAALFGLQQVGCRWGVGWSLSYTEYTGTGDGTRTGAGLFLHRRF